MGNSVSSTPSQQQVGDAAAAAASAAISVPPLPMMTMMMTTTATTTAKAETQTAKNITHDPPASATRISAVEVGASRRPTSHNDRHLSSRPLPLSGGGTTAAFDHPSTMMTVTSTTKDGDITITSNDQATTTTTTTSRTASTTDEEKVGTSISNKKLVVHDARSNINNDGGVVVDSATATTAGTGYDGSIDDDDDDIAPPVEDRVATSTVLQRQQAQQRQDLHRHLQLVRQQRQQQQQQQNQQLSHQQRDMLRREQNQKPAQSEAQANQPGAIVLPPHKTTATKGTLTTTTATTTMLSASKVPTVSEQLPSLLFQKKIGVAGEKVPGGGLSKSHRSSIMIPALVDDETTTTVCSPVVVENSPIRQRQQQQQQRPPIPEKRHDHHNNNRKPPSLPPLQHPQQRRRGLQQKVISSPPHRCSTNSTECGEDEEEDSTCLLNKLETVPVPLVYGNNSNKNTAGSSSSSSSSSHDDSSSSLLPPSPLLRLSRTTTISSTNSKAPIDKYRTGLAEEEDEENDEDDDDGIIKIAHISIIEDDLDLQGCAEVEVLNSPRLEAINAREEQKRRQHQEEQEQELGKQQQQPLQAFVEEEDDESETDDEEDEGGHDHDVVDEAAAGGRHNDDYDEEEEAYDEYPYNEEEEEADDDDDDDEFERRAREIEREYDEFEAQIAREKEEALQLRHKEPWYDGDGEEDDLVAEEKKMDDQQLHRIEAAAAAAAVASGDLPASSEVINAEEEYSGMASTTTASRAERFASTSSSSFTRLGHPTPHTLLSKNIVRDNPMLFMDARTSQHQLKQEHPPRHANEEQAELMVLPVIDAEQEYTRVVASSCNTSASNSINLPSEVNNKSSSRKRGTSLASSVTKITRDFSDDSGIVKRNIIKTAHDYSDDSGVVKRNVIDDSREGDASDALKSVGDTTVVDIGYFGGDENERRMQRQWSLSRTKTATTAAKTDHHEHRFLSGEITTTHEDNTTMTTTAGRDDRYRHFSEGEDDSNFAVTATEASAAHAVAASDNNDKDGETVGRTEDVSAQTKNRTAVTNVADGDAFCAVVSDNSFEPDGVKARSNEDVEENRSRGESLACSGTQQSLSQLLGAAIAAQTSVDERQQNHQAETYHLGTLNSRWEGDAQAIVSKTMASRMIAVDSSRQEEEVSQVFPSPAADGIDLDFVQQYAKAIELFLREHPGFTRRDREMVNILRIVKLQKMLESSAYIEDAITRYTERVRRQKDDMTSHYHRQLLQSSKLKAQREIQLTSEIEYVNRATVVMEGKLTWQLITMSDNRVKKYEHMVQQLNEQYYDGIDPTDPVRSLPSDILGGGSGVNRGADTDTGGGGGGISMQSIRDARNAPPTSFPMETDEQEKDLLQFQVDNAFMHAEVAVLEKRLAYQRIAAKKHAWVDAVFRRMDGKTMKKLKQAYQKKLGATF